VRCPSDALSLLYRNPPYDFETGQTNNQRLELVFLERTYRWLMPRGVLVFVIPQPQLQPCARILSEHFTDWHRPVTLSNLSILPCCPDHVCCFLRDGSREFSAILSDSAIFAIRRLAVLGGTFRITAIS
jgi:hypothetical protein